MYDATKIIDDRLEELYVKLKNKNLCMREIILLATRVDELISIRRLIRTNQL